VANGFRPQKKLTQMQLTQEIAKLNSRVDLLTNIVAGDIKRLNILLFSYLKEQGKAQEIVCPKCEVMNIRPYIEGIEIDPRCADCGYLLEELPQEAFDGQGSLMDGEE